MKFKLVFVSAALLIAMAATNSYAESKHFHTLPIKASNSTPLAIFLLKNLSSKNTPCPQPHISSGNWVQILQGTSNQKVKFRVKTHTGNLCLAYYLVFPPSYTWTINPILIRPGDRVGLEIYQDTFAFFLNGKPIDFSLKRMKVK